MRDQMTFACSDKAMLKENGLRILGENAFAAVHEMRSPLVGVHAMLQLMRARSLKEGADTAEFDMLLERLEQVCRLGDRMLLLGRPDNGDIAAVDMAQLCRSALSLLRSRAIMAEAVLDEDIDADIPSLYGVEADLFRLIINLLSNAVEAVENIEGERKVTLSLKAKEGNILLKVSDNGRGMESSVMEKIFMPHFSTKPKGGGIGLSLSQSIANAHGGEIKVISSVGQGSIFTVELPLEGKAKE